MNIVIIMPTMRWQNWPQVLENIEAVRAAAGGIVPVEITLMPVMYLDEWAEVPVENRAMLFQHWIELLVVHPEPGGHIISHKLNVALDHLDGACAKHAPDTWFFPGADDDLIPPTFARRFADAADENADVIVASVKRGQHVTATGYPTFPLIGSPENMRVYHVTGSQALIRFGALQGLRFQHHPCQDGILIEELHRRASDKFRYIPDYFLPFNALEPGRWDADKLKELIEK